MSLLVLQHSRSWSLVFTWACRQSPSMRLRASFSVISIRGSRSFFFAKIKAQMIEKVCTNHKCCFGNSGICVLTARQFGKFDIGRHVEWRIEPLWTLNYKWIIYLFRIKLKPRFMWVSFLTRYTVYCSMYLAVYMLRKSLLRHRVGLCRVLNKNCRFLRWFKVSCGFFSLVDRTMILQSYHWCCHHQRSVLSCQFRDDQLSS